MQENRAEPADAALRHVFVHDVGCAQAGLRAGGGEVLNLDQRRCGWCWRRGWRGRAAARAACCSEHGARDGDPYTSHLIKDEAMYPWTPRVARFDQLVSQSSTP